MSVDAYFCFCCLSTNELVNLYNDKPDTNYANMLEELFSIKPVQEEYEYDSYVCEMCAKSLTDARTFRQQVFDTLNALQVNGLINMEKSAEHILISKVTNDFESDVEDKYSMETSHNEIKQALEESLSTLYNSPHCEIEDIKAIEEPIDKNTDIQSDIVLKNEKRITVPRKKKRVTDEPKNKEPLYKVTDDLKCTICSTVLPNVYVYHTHMNKHFPNHICETCGKGFLTKKRLKRHMPSHIKGPFKCQSCDAEFNNYNTLSSHRQRKHSDVQLYACPYCPERFATFTRRARHLADIHRQSTDKYSCPVCQKTFLLAGNLSSHIARHLGVRRHVCSTCGASYSSAQDLRGHMATHTGLNEYPCTLCPKRYPRKKALDVHMRTHTGDKRFCCDVCGHKFTQKCTLLAHYKTHNRKEGKNRTQPDIVVVSNIKYI